MKLLVVGGTGMLGHKLLQRLTEKYPDTYATVRQDLTEAPFCRVPFLQSDKIQRNMNVLATDSLRRTILDLKPDYILNCIGIVTQHKQHADPVSCIRVNSLLPHEIASIAAEYGGRVIHFSTDCVFDGKMGGYCEDDPPNATDVYGRSKALGELFCENTLTLRTSIIGRELRNYGSLLDWFLRHSGGRIKGYTRAIYSGVTTNEMANVVKLILERFPTLTGLFQVVADPISKYDLLRLAREKFKVPVEIEPYDGFVIDRSMKGDKFASVTGYRSPSWPELMQDLADESDLYWSWGINLCAS